MQIFTINKCKLQKEDDEPSVTVSSFGNNAHRIGSTTSKSVGLPRTCY